jgi:hypothetical protein
MVVELFIVLSVEQNNKSGADILTLAVTPKQRTSFELVMGLNSPISRLEDRG